jgi:cobalamin-dependent methionine synthase I
VPSRTPGIHEFLDYDLATLREVIDWSPFFAAWEMRGRSLTSLNNPTHGTEARKLYDDAQRMLDLDRRGEVAASERQFSGCSRPMRSVTTSRCTPTASPQ